jgi:hypothetical protein
MRAAVMQPLAMRLGWLVGVRLLFSTLLFGLAGFFYLHSGFQIGTYSNRVLFVTLLCTYGLSALCLMGLQRGRQARGLAYAELVGDQALWPRRGDQSQHQTVEGSHVCWTKYALPWMYECWRWDEQWVYHEVDHGIDARRWEYYTLSDGRWLPRHLTVGTDWSLDVAAAFPSA